ncbi:Uma2 family endonuclease [Actinokineospora enzanensis]|uniref:Uma2 family endonuclease n=1 Tax=Actinokineospora enzanensis TaxID=155975 RepID=UPI000364121F|nr:Uma2 family endonuclease [Actinokineospora enzanensis]
MSSIQAHGGRRLTLQQFADLPPESSFIHELDEGILRVSPRPVKLHQLALGRLFTQIETQLPPELLVFPEIDVDLGLEPPTVRVPDLTVTATTTVYDDTFTAAKDVVLVVEVVSPGSRRVDLLTKPEQYARAGIPHFWRVVPGYPMSVTVFDLVDGNYQEVMHVQDVLKVDSPCPLLIYLDALLP